MSNSVAASLDASGQLEAVRFSKPTSFGEQTARPSAAAVFTTRPSGKSIRMKRVWEGSRTFTPPAEGCFSVMSRPVGAEVWWLVGTASIVGPKGRWLQPLMIGKGVVTSFSGKSSGSGQLEALTPTLRETPQRVGLVKKGSSFPPGGREGEVVQAWENTSAGVQRSLLWAAAAGTPQKVDSSFSTRAAAGALVIS